MPKFQMRAERKDRDKRFQAANKKSKGDSVKCAAGLL